MAANRKLKKDTVQLSKDFVRAQFACKCGCGFDTVDYNLIVVLQTLVDRSGRKIDVVAGCRCPRESKKYNGSPGNAHEKGRGAIISIPEMPEIKLPYMTNSDFSRIVDKTYGDLIWYYCVKNTDKYLYIDVMNT